MTQACKDPTMGVPAVKLTMDGSALSILKEKHLFVKKWTLVEMESMSQNSGKLVMMGIKTKKMDVWAA